jgi:hypothetical protein
MLRLQFAVFVSVFAAADVCALGTLNLGPKLLLRELY